MLRVYDNIQLCSEYGTTKLVDIGTPFCGRPYSKSPTILGSVVGPLIFGNSHLGQRSSLSYGFYMESLPPWRPGSQDDKARPKRQKKGCGSWPKLHFLN